MCVCARAGERLCSWLVETDVPNINQCNNSYVFWGIDIGLSAYMLICFPMHVQEVLSKWGLCRLSFSCDLLLHRSYCLDPCLRHQIIKGFMLCWPLMMEFVGLHDFVTITQWLVVWNILFFFDLGTPNFQHDVFWSFNSVAMEWLIPALQPLIEKQMC